MRKRDNRDERDERDDNEIEYQIISVVSAVPAVPAVLNLILREAHHTFNLSVFSLKAKGFYTHY